jgi:hypothetical protein
VFDRQRALAVGGFRASMTPAEDVDLWTRLSDDGVVLTLPERLVLYRVRASSESTSRFFEQMERADLIAVNAKRRRARQCEITPAAWHAMRAGDPLGVRLRRARLWRSRYFYRLGGGLLADRRSGGVLYLALATVLAPLTVVRRLRRQGVLGRRPRARSPEAEG